MPRTWRAGGIIGPTTAKQNAGAGGVEVWSLEKYEEQKSLGKYEKQKKLQKHAERHGTAAAGSKIKGVHKPVRKPKPGETKRKNIKT